jgi:hypothetical protein
MRKITLTLALALAFAGSAAFTADAQTSRGANNIASTAQNFRRTGGVPGMGTLLPAGIHPRLRPLALLVPPLLVIDKREAAATAASFPYRVP